MHLIDPQVGPYSSREDIEAAIEQVKKLPDSAEKTATMELLRGWLEPIGGPSVAS